MTPQTIVAIVAVVLSSLFSAGALRRSKESAKLAKASNALVLANSEQADRARREAAEPRVWVDIRPNEEHGQFLMLYVGNNGPTVATDVRVTFEPPLRIDGGEIRGHKIAEAVAQLSDGLTSVPPGRRFQWSLGVVAEVVADLNAGGYQVEVNAVGPYGPLPAVKFPINVQDLRYNLAAPPGTLNGVVVALEKATEKIVGAIAASRAVRRDEPPTGL